MLTPNYTVNTISDQKRDNPALFLGGAWVFPLEHDLSNLMYFM